MLNLCYLENLRRVDTNNVTTYPKSSDSLDYKLMLATYYGLVSNHVRESWDQERIKGTWSGLIYNSLDKQILIQDSIGTYKEQIKYLEEDEIGEYIERAKRAIDFSCLLRAKGIISYIGYDSILVLEDDNEEDIFDYQELVKMIVTSRFKYVFYIKKDSILLIDVDTLRKDYWRDKGEIHN